MFHFVLSEENLAKETKLIEVEFQIQKVITLLCLEIFHIDSAEI